MMLNMISFLIILSVDHTYYPPTDGYTVLVVYASSLTSIGCLSIIRNRQKIDNQVDYQAVDYCIDYQSWEKE